MASHLWIELTCRLIRQLLLEGPRQFCQTSHFVQIFLRLGQIWLKQLS